jgi:hypothetical protein
MTDGQSPLTPRVHPGLLGLQQHNRPVQPDLGAGKWRYAFEDGGREAG